MKKHLILFALILIQGCSSGGGDSVTPTAPTTEFHLFPIGSFSAGYTDTQNLTGTDTAGGIYTGTLSSQTQAQSTFLGQAAVPILIQLQLTNTANGALVSSISTGYYSTSATDRHYLGSSDSTQTTVSAVTSAIPLTATIGSFGVIGTYTFNTGNVVEQSWRLDDGGNGLAKRVLLSTLKNQFNQVEFSTTTTSTIDTSGNFITTQLVIYYPSTGITITLNAK